MATKKEPERQRHVRRNASSTSEAIPGVASALAGAPVGYTPVRGEIVATPIHLQGVALRALTYREVEGERLPPGQQPSGRASTDISLGGQLNFYGTSEQPAVVELSLSIEVRPNRAIKPVEVDATVSALFASADSSLPLVDLVRFVNLSGARVVFPYIRELVSAATARGIYGPLFLDPILVGPFLGDEELEAAVNSYLAAN